MENQDDQQVSTAYRYRPQPNPQRQVDTAFLAREFATHIVQQNYREHSSDRVALTAAHAIAALNDLAAQLELEQQRNAA